MRGDNDFYTGNPQEVLKSISDRHKLLPTGDPSLQNAIEMARNSMRCVFIQFNFNTID